MSADAFAVYRGLDVGTAKPSAAQRAAVRYHMVDVADPGEPFSAGRYAERGAPDRRGDLAARAASDRLRRKRVLRRRRFSAGCPRSRRETGAFGRRWPHGPRGEGPRPPTASSASTIRCRRRAFRSAISSTRCARSRSCSRPELRPRRATPGATPGPRGSACESSAWFRLERNSMLGLKIESAGCSSRGGTRKCGGCSRAVFPGIRIPFRRSGIGRWPSGCSGASRNERSRRRS